MEVLARIPELTAAAVAVEHPEADPGTPSANRPARAPRRHGSVRSGGRAGRLVPPPTIVLLAAVAAAVWTAAWRSERLRLEAQRARPERLALEPSAAGHPSEFQRP